jgi:hypothetical protein
MGRWRTKESPTMYDPLAAQPYVSPAAGAYYGGHSLGTSTCWKDEGRSAARPDRIACAASYQSINYYAPHSQN